MTEDQNFTQGKPPVEFYFVGWVTLLAIIAAIGALTRTDVGAWIAIVAATVSVSSVAFILWEIRDLIFRWLKINIKREQGRKK